MQQHFQTINYIINTWIKFLAISIPFWNRHMFKTVGFIQSLKLLFIPIVACLVTNHLKIWNTIITIYLNDEIKLICDLPFPPLSSFSALWGDSRYWGLEILVNIVISCIYLLWLVTFALFIPCGIYNSHYLIFFF